MDTGIVLGQAIREAVGDKKGMVRFGSCILPMDEALVIQCNCHIQSLCTCLEHSFDHMVAVLSGEQLKVEIHTCAVRKGVEKLPDNIQKKPRYL